MKRTASVFGLFLFFAVGFAVAQTTAPLVLPATDRLVISTCYIRWVTKTSVKLFKRDDLSQQEYEGTDKFLATFTEGMTREGFKVSLSSRCSDTDDPEGGITVKFVLQPGTENLILVQAFLKVPGEKRVVPVAEKTTVPKKIVGIEEVASSLVRETSRNIKEAQSPVRGQ